MSLAPTGAKDERAAFTLLELLAVITLLAILTAMVIGVGRRAVESGQSARAKAELAALAIALEAYRRTYGDYPQTDDAARLLQSLLARRGPANAATEGRPLLELVRWTTVAGKDPQVDPTAQLADPWGQPYRYSYKVPLPWTNSSYVLYSAGPDVSDFPRLLAGGFPDAAAAGNADNLYANR